MHSQLETLLEIQDLKTQRRELQETEREREVEQEVFHMSVEDALVELDLKIREMEDSLDPKVRGRYDRLSGKHPRVVVPVLKGTCYGCFVSVPTAVSSSAARNDEIRFCENCGRFLYHVD